MELRIMVLDCTHTEATPTVRYRVGETSIEDSAELTIQILAAIGDMVDDAGSTIIKHSAWVEGGFDYVDRKGMTCAGKTAFVLIHTRRYNAAKGESTLTAEVYFDGAYGRQEYRAVER